MAGEQGVGEFRDRRGRPFEYIRRRDQQGIPAVVVELTRRIQLIHQRDRIVDQTPAQIDLSQRQPQM